MKIILAFIAGFFGYDLVERKSNSSHLTKNDPLRGLTSKELEEIDPDNYFDPVTGEWTPYDPKTKTHKRTGKYFKNGKWEKN